ncbi:MAG: hypothetical protein WBG08_08580 [Litorimonas sp.]
MARLSVLCLVGSFETDEMRELSELYARGCLSALGHLHDFSVLHRTPDGSWRLVRSLDPQALRRDAKMSFPDAVAAVASHRFDIGLPQMFCRTGMTAGRALFDLLGLPFIGNDAVAMGLTADKALARAVVSAAGVRVPDGKVIRQGCVCDPPLPLPLIVKPVASDNSDGLGLVRGAEGFQSALNLAFRDGDALVEQFIPPGRELRCAVIEQDGALLPLPPEEYPVGRDRPIRTKTDKLARPGGVLTLAAKTRDAAWIVKPGDPAIPGIQAASLDAYRALCCRHYGLFDFRVDDAGRVWFLEAGLYCSFSPQSVIAVMADAAGIALPDLFERLATPLLPASASARPAA